MSLHVSALNRVFGLNPTKPNHIGFSIGHGKSSNQLEIRVADGNAFESKSIRHPGILLGARCNRTIHVVRSAAGRSFSLKVDDQDVGSVMFDGFTRDIYESELLDLDIEFGNVWGWMFDGILHSMSLQFESLSDSTQQLEHESHQTNPEAEQEDEVENKSKHQENATGDIIETLREKKHEERAEIPPPNVEAGRADFTPRPWSFHGVFGEKREKKTKQSTLVEHSAALADVINGPGFTLSLITTPTSERRPNSHCPLFIATNPTRKSHHGVSIGHKQSHSELEVRLGDGLTMESVKLQHSRVALDKPCNRTVRLLRKESGRVLDVWIDSEHIGTKDLPELGGDLYAGDGGVVFGNVWDWSFTGTLDSLTIHAAGETASSSEHEVAEDAESSSESEAVEDADNTSDDVDSKSSAPVVSPEAVPMDDDSTEHIRTVPDSASENIPGNARDNSVDDILAEPDPERSTDESKSASTPASDLEAVEDARSHQLHEAKASVEPDAANVVSSVEPEKQQDASVLPRSVTAWFSKVFGEKREKKTKQSTLVEHSAALADVINGPGFTLSLITTPTSERRPNSHCPLFIATNPTRKSHHGVSIGHKQSHSELEVRLGDGLTMESVKLQHSRVALDKPCNRTVRLLRRESGRVLDVWIDSEHIGTKDLPELGGDLYAGDGGVVFGNVWDWSFTGTLDSLTIHAAGETASSSEHEVAEDAESSSESEAVEDADNTSDDVDSKSSAPVVSPEAVPMDDDSTEHIRTVPDSASENIPGNARDNSVDDILAEPDPERSTDESKSASTPASDLEAVEDARSHQLHEAKASVEPDAANVVSSVEPEKQQDASVLPRSVTAWFSKVFGEKREKKTKQSTLVEHSAALADVINGPGFTLSLITTPTSESRPNSHCPLFIATNPTHKSHHGVSIGHKQSHSELEVRLGDGLTMESVKLQHSRVALDKPCNRTVRLLRKESGRVLDVWIDSEHIGTKDLPELGGDLYAGDGGVVFGNVWDWSFTGTLDSLTILAEPLELETTGFGSGPPPKASLSDVPDIKVERIAAKEKEIAPMRASNVSDRNSVIADSHAEEDEIIDASETAPSVAAWFHKDFHARVEEDQLDPFVVVPHSDDLQRLINGDGFSLTVITSATSSKRAKSQCPLYIATNPTRKVENGVSIGHQASHSEIEVRISDGSFLESIKFGHARVPLETPCNRTLRVSRTIDAGRVDGRIIEVWIDGTHVGSKHLPQLNGDLYTGGNGIVFGDVWGWSFSGVLQSVTLNPIQGSNFLKEVFSDDVRNEDTFSSQQLDTHGASEEDDGTTSTTASAQHLWYHKEFTNATGHFAVVPDEDELKRRSPFGRANSEKTVGGEPLGPLEVIPHSDVLGRVINGRGFVLTVVSTPDGNGGKPGRALSQCPLRISDNPRSSTDYGFSIGHHASDKGLEIRMADGTSFGVQTIHHAQQDWDSRCNRTLRITRSSKGVFPDVEDEQGRTAELWIDGVYMGHAHFPGVTRDLYDTKKGGVLGDVWGWGFSGTLHSVSLSPVWRGDLQRGSGLSAEELADLFGDEEFEFDVKADGNLNDDDVLDEDLDELEEFVFYSPSDVQDQWRSSLEEIKHFAKEAERKGNEEALEGMPDACR